MIKFNSTNIVVGEIKELLKSFNLPSYKVLVDNEPVFIFKGTSYIYKNQIMISNVTKPFKDGFIYNSDDFTYHDTYYFGQNILNITHTLAVKTRTYDYSTHNRLGNYLRFVRDYEQLDLMSMYNCFNGQSANNIDISFKMKQTDINEVVFDTSNDSYKIFTVPVRYYKKYTFFVDCATNFEIVGCYYLNNNQLNSLQVGTVSTVLNDYVYRNTYQKVTGASFNTPVVYDKLENLLFDINDAEIRQTLAKKEIELVLLVKLPKNNNSSLVVLEGDYSKDNMLRYYPSTTAFSSFTNYISNYDKNYNYLNDYNKYNSYKQLTYINDGNSYPFADRLIEYLVGNVITPLDDIYLDNKRVETNLIEKGVIDGYTPFYEWTNELRARIYLNALKNNILNNKFDVLGYVDKDIEEKVVGFEDKSNEWEV